MKTNINDVIFSRTQPLKKIAIINGLTNDELLTITKATITKIVKEAGRNRYKSRDKELFISYDRRAGNNWNSTVERISLVKKALFVNIYIQYDSTDTCTVETYDEFFRKETYKGSIERDDYRGNPRTYYFDYDIVDKAKVIKSILLEYVFTKYADKLKREEEV